MSPARPLWSLLHTPSLPQALVESAIALEVALQVAVPAHQEESKAGAPEVKARVVEPWFRDLVDCVDVMTHLMAPSTSKARFLNLFRPHAVAMHSHTLQSARPSSDAAGQSQQASSKATLGAVPEVAASAPAGAAAGAGGLGSVTQGTALTQRQPPIARLAALEVLSSGQAKRGGVIPRLAALEEALLGAVGEGPVLARIAALEV